jgi:hypothetical protein
MDGEAFRVSVYEEINIRAFVWMSLLFMIVAFDG